MAHVRSEGTGTTPALQLRMEERDRQLDRVAHRWWLVARSDRNRERRTPLPPEALEAE